MPPSVKQYAKLAALGAIGVAVGTLALAAFIGFGSRPTTTGGIDATHSLLTWLGVIVPALAIAAAHVAYAKILFDEARRD